MKAVSTQSPFGITFRLILLVSITLLISFESGISQNQKWQQYLYNDDVRDIEINEETTWIATTGGLIQLDEDLEEARRFTSLNSDLPCNFIEELAVDKDGIVWIRHCYGISSFDGSDFVNYDIQDSKITLDQDQNIFVVVPTGFHFWNGTDFDYLDLLTAGFDLQVGSVYVEPTGVIWFTRMAYLQFDFFRYEEGQMSTFTTFNTDLPLEFQTYLEFVPRSSGGVSIILAGDFFGYEDGQWIAEPGFDNRWSDLVVNQDGSYSYLVRRTEDEIQNTYLVRMTNSFEVISEQLIDGVDLYGDNLVVDNDKILFGDRYRGLFKVVDNQTAKINLTKSDLNNNYVSAINEVNDEIWFNVGSYSTYSPLKYSVLAFDDAEWKIKNEDYPFQESEEFEFPGYFSKGLGDTTYMIHDRQLYFQTGNLEWNATENPDLLEDVNENYCSIFFDKDGSKWLMDLWSGNIFYQSPLGWKIFLDDTHPANVGSIYSYTSPFNHPSTGDLWFSSYRGIAIYNYESDSWSKVDYEEMGIDCSIARTVLTEEGEIYGICYNNFFRIEGQEAEVLQVVDSIGSVGYFSSIYEDREGKILLGLQDKVAIYDQGQWSYLTPRNSGLVNGRIGDVYQDKDRNYWFASSTGGMAVYNEEGLADHFTNDFPLDIEEVSDNKFTILPNPTNRFITLKSMRKDAVNSINVVEIYSLSGKMMYTSSNIEDSIIDVSSFDSGVYVLKIGVDSRYEMHKIVKL